MWNDAIKVIDDLQAVIDDYESRKTQVFVSIEAARPSDRPPGDDARSASRLLYALMDYGPAMMEVVKDAVRVVRVHDGTGDLALVMAIARMKRALELFAEVRVTGC